MKGSTIVGLIKSCLVKVKKMEKFTLTRILGDLGMKGAFKFNRSDSVRNRSLTAYIPSDLFDEVIQE